jgi:hypothetical protein
MHQPMRPTIDDTLSAFLRTLTGANKSQATITSYRTDFVPVRLLLGQDQLHDRHAGRRQPRR